jgi:hypothetical protein
MFASRVDGRRDMALPPRTRRRPLSSDSTFCASHRAGRFKSLFTYYRADRSAATAFFGVPSNLNRPPVARYR